MCTVRSAHTGVATSEPVPFPVAPNHSPHINQYPALSPPTIRLISTSTLPCRPQPFASYQPVPCRIWDVVGRHGPVDFAASPGRSYISNHVARLGALGLALNPSANQWLEWKWGCVWIGCGVGSAGHTAAAKEAEWQRTDSRRAVRGHVVWKEPPKVVTLRTSIDILYERKHARSQNGL